MSIIKNDNNISHTNVTIMRMDKTTPLSSPPLPTDHRLIGFLAKKAVEMNNVCYQMDWYSAAGESVIIKCQLEENAQGVIYGYTNRRIIKVIDGTGNWIRWMSGNTVEAQVAWDENIHVYGYKGSDEDWLNNGYCTPYYDGELIASSVHNTSNYIDYQPRIGALPNSTDCLVSSGTWAIRLYEVMAYSYYYQSYSAKLRHIYHYYAALVDNGQTTGLMETRCVLRFVGVRAGTGTTRNVAVDFSENEQGYGLDLEDLSFISGYIYMDVIGCVCADGKVATELGWTNATADSPYKINNKDFAFYLPTIPVKDETSRGPSRQGYLEGELIKGRKPQWQIWNDAIKFGKYGDQPSAGQLTTMRFNIFKENNGQSVTRLEMLKFDGYNQANNCPPSFEWSGVVDMEFHNGVLCKMDTSNLIVGRAGSHKALAVYSPNFATGGDLGFVKLGNLPLWNYSTAEQDEDAGLDTLRSYGGGLIIRAKDGGSSSNWSRVGALLGVTNETYVSPHGGTVARPLSSDTSDKSLKTVGVNCSGFFRRDSSVSYWRNQLLTNGTKDLKMDLCLSKTTDNNPLDGDLIDCGQLVPSKEGILRGVFDTGSSHVAEYNDVKDDDRLIVGEEGGVAKIGGNTYPIGIQTYASELHYIGVAVTPTPYSTYGTALAFGFALKNGNDFLSLFTNNNPNVFGYAQIVEETKAREDNTVTDTQITIEVDDDDYTYYQHWVQRNGVLVDCQIKSGNKYAYTRSVDALTGDILFNISFTVPAGQMYDDKVDILMMHKIGGITQQTTMVYEYNAYNDTSDACDGSVSIRASRVSNNTASKLTIDHCFYGMTESDGVAESYTITNRYISGRYYGFAKPVFDYGTNPPSGYYEPWNYGAHGSDFFQNNVMPWNTPVDWSQGKMGALFFMWQDLYTLGADQTDKVRPTNPITAWVRIFSATNGPHAWDLLNREFDTDSECPYIAVDGHTYLFHTHDRLIESGNSDFIDTYMTIWDNGNQITALSELEGKTIILYEAPLYEPKDTTRTKTEIVRFVWSSGDTASGYADNPIGARCEIQSGLTVYDYLDTGLSPQYETTGVYRLRIHPQNISTIMLPDPTPGTMYYLEITV